MNHLRDSFVQLFAVREGGLSTHYVVAPVLPDAPLRRPAICGAKAPLTSGRPKWRRVSSPGKKTCGACHAKACSRPTRVVWS